MFKLFLISVFMALPAALAEEGVKTVIINKVDAKAQSVTAPALKPSQAKKLRSAREEAEIETESAIIEKLESERLRDEQQRVDRLLNPSAKKISAGAGLSPGQTGQADASVAASSASWTFGNKAFVFGGIGAVQYLDKSIDINSLEIPAFFLGFGGYGSDHLIIDAVGYYSEHYIKDSADGSNRKVVQPAFSMSIKYSPFSGRVKPYAGLSAAYLHYRHYPVDEAGEAIEGGIENKSRKKWVQAFDGGAALGADVALANNLGLGLDLRFHANLWTESVDERALDKKESAIFSANIKYYF